MIFPSNRIISVVVICLEMGWTIALSEVKSRKGNGDISMQSCSIVIHSQLGFDEHLDERQKWP